MKKLQTFVLLLLVIVPFFAQAEDAPLASYRNSNENYKDMLLARCIATAYQADPIIRKDAAATANILVNWTYYDAENSVDAITQLINHYLSHKYENPFEGYEGVHFNLLKCFDLYHSTELQKQVKKFVSNPNGSASKENRKFNR